MTQDLGDLESDRHSKTGTVKLCGMCRQLEREREFRLLLGTPSSLFVCYAFFVVWLPPFILPPIYNILAASVVCVEPPPDPTQPLSASHAQSVIAGCPGPRGGNRGGGGGTFPMRPKKQLSRG